MNDDVNRPVLSDQAVQAILGMTTAVPVLPEAMARSLTVTFFPVHKISERVLAFSDRLRNAFTTCDVGIVRYEDALLDAGTEKLREGIVVIAPGDLETGDLPVDHVTNLRRATVVGIVDGPCPAHTEKHSQERLNSVVRMLAWNIVQVVIYVDDDSWTVCTMNGAIIRCSYAAFAEDVFHVLIPKIAAPVVPPHASDFDVREGGLDLHDARYRAYVQDFQESGKLWADTGLMLFHTSLESLEFRNRYYKRLAAAYLDHRSGMSYGFLARQLAIPPAQVLTMVEAGAQFGPDAASGDVLARQDALWVKARMPGSAVWVHVPDVWMLTSRSGCDKSNIDPQRDLVMLGLSRGTVIFATPRGVSPGLDCKPSYDTLTILAHAAANAIVAGIQAALSPASRFAAAFASSGLALAHWHGYLHHALLPAGYVVHGEKNPPVSCSTYQAAIFALRGKVDAFATAFAAGRDFAGDAHIEPHHGVNVTGPTLLWLAQWALDNAGLLAEIQASAEVPAGREAIGR
ncbi:MAG: hypothetical protein IT282_16600 [Bacteroidetes bacterium]|nr:hypothetical protein [Bacteroidota bacterium]